ncbi:MAG TPA: hypothetical protein VFQ85_09435 [Mycobacteriales bacterium]|jgi:hypothetical protein|nr:hypothetical protein [Mycobacteriales bacterium]
MTELFPVAGGFVVGVVLASLRPGSRRALGAVCAVLVGIAATVVSGEYRAGWEFLLVDVPLAAAGAVAGAYLARRAVAAGRAGPR